MLARTVVAHRSSLFLKLDVHTVAVETNKSAETFLLLNILLRSGTKFRRETAGKQFRTFRVLTCRKFASTAQRKGGLRKKGKQIVDPSDTVDDAMIHSCLFTRLKLRAAYDVKQKDKYAQMRDAYVGSM